MIKEHLTLFEQYLKYEKRMSAHTLLAYNYDLNQFVAYLAGTYELEDTARIEALHVRSYLVYLNELKHKERSVQRKISAIKSFFKFLLKREMLSTNPVAQIKAPKPPARLPVFLEQHQSSKLFTEVSYPEGWEGLTHQLILELLYQTGIRRGELISLKERDVDLFRNELVVLGKRNKERAIPIGADLVQLIREYLKEKKRIIISEHDNLLTLESGKPLYDNYVYRVVNRYLSQDITTLSKRSPHIMRHTFATHLTHNGAGINAIKELLGHSSLAATQIYTHSNIEHLKKIYQQAHPKATNES
ncbi:MAG: integrase [Sphingobacteriales bacterium]|nr:MAG: integrase [Sphingobacteriales bacterium]